MTQGMEWMLIVWGIVTGIFLILLFCRSTLTSKRMTSFSLMSLPHQGRRNKAN